MPALPPSRRRSTARTAASPHPPKGESSPVPRQQQNGSEVSLCSDQHCAGCCFPAKELFFSPQAGPTGTARKDPGEEWNFQSPSRSCTFTGWARSSAAPIPPHTSSPRRLPPRASGDVGWPPQPAFIAAAVLPPVLHPQSHLLHGSVPEGEQQNQSPNNAAQLLAPLCVTLGVVCRLPLPPLIF